MTTSRTQIENLRENQRKYAAFWKERPKFSIPKDEWPEDWHVAHRYRCVNDHVCVGMTRLGACRACSAAGDPDVAVMLTSPADESGPFNFEVELVAHGDLTGTD